MRRPMSWFVVGSSAVLLLTAMRLSGGCGNGDSYTRENPPMAVGEPSLAFAYLPRETAARAVIPALLTTRESEIPTTECAPLLQFELLTNRVK